MKNKKLLSLAVAFATLGSVVGCGGTTNTSSSATTSTDPILVWVGAESVDFYKAKLAEYKASKNLPVNFDVKGVDTGEAADTFLADTDAGADIFTIAHDNIGKLTAGTPAIMPISGTAGQALLDQINADNPAAFLDVVKSTVGGTTFTFAAPYISQALVLYYDAEAISATQVASWEGIKEAAATAGKKATTVVGTDLYNFSWPLLAKRTDGTTTLKLYEGGNVNNCNVDGDDTVASMKWAQDFFADPNGGLYPQENTTWEQQLQSGAALSVVGGAWNYNAAKAALGSKLGVAKLPSFTLTADSAYGTAVEGTTYNSGTFADCKAFVMKNGSKHAAYLYDVVKFLTSKDVQEESYEQCNNLPAYKNAATEFEAMNADTLEAKLAKTQIEMFESGIAQPFGYDVSFNKRYYSSVVSESYQYMITNTDNGIGTLADIKAALTEIENVLINGHESIAG